MGDEERTGEQLQHEIAYLRLLVADQEDKLHQCEEILKVLTDQYLRITATVSDYIFSVHLIDGKPVNTVHGHGCLAITGYSPEEFTENKYLWIDMVYEEDKPAVRKHVANIFSGKEVKPLEHRVVCKDGSIRWIRNIPVCQYDIKGRLVAYDGLIKDITERKLAFDALHQSEEKYRLVADFTYDWEHWINQDGFYLYVSPSCERITGYRPQEFMADPDLLLKIVHPDDYEIVRRHFHEDFRETGEVFHFDFRIITRSGEMRWIEHSCQSVFQRDGTWYGRRGSNREITDRKRLEEELRELSLHDDLTGLYNRRGFVALSEQQIKIASRIRRRVILVIADIDGMKWINDTLGHEEGDRALVEAASLLKRTFREADIIARVGGDEFAVLAVATDENFGELFSLRLQESLDSQKGNNSHPFNLSLSIGIACYDPKLPNSLADLMAQADARMYDNKMSRRASAEPHSARKD